MTSWRDTISKISGVATKSKLEKLNSLNVAWDICNNWVKDNVESLEFEPEDAELVQAIEDVQKLNLRLNKQASVEQTDELVSDLIRSMDAYLIFAYMVAADNGFVPSESQLQNDSLARVAGLGGPALIPEYKEAVNLVGHLLDKYPY